MDDSTRALPERGEAGLQADLRRSAHPVLQRAAERAQSQTGREITSYDRMHHRHNRS